MADMDFDYLRLKIVLFLTFFMIIGIPSNLKSYIVEVAKARPDLFYHWQMGIRPTMR